VSRFICIGNQKGGAGKTTTTATLGAALAIWGARVLLVDLDSQGNLSTSLGLTPRPKLFDLLINRSSLESCVVETGRKNLWLLPGDSTTAEAKETLAGRSFREQALAKALQPARGKFDYILMDCAPSLDVLNICALVAAREVIMPVPVEYLAMVGAAAYSKILDQFAQDGLELKLTAVVPTFYDEVTVKCREGIAVMRQQFGDKLADPIKKDVRIAEAPSFGRTIWEYRSKCAAADGYAALMNRVIAAGAI